MCTLILFYKLVDNFPVVVLHNRYIESVSIEKPPRKTELKRIIYSPIDCASGGTWIGLNSDGLIVAVTNQSTARITNPKRSRGMLLFDVLRDFSDAESTKEFLCRPKTRLGYRRGNFAVVDAASAWHVVWDREIIVRDIVPGAYVISTLTMLPDIDWTEKIERSWQRVEKRRLRALRLAEQLDTSKSDGFFWELMTLAADHGEVKGSGSICYHDPSGDNHHSSSTIVAVAETFSSSRIYYCPGNPCEGKFSDYSPILSSLT